MLVEGRSQLVHTLVHSVSGHLLVPTTLSPFGGLHLPDLPTQ